MAVGYEQAPEDVVELAQELVEKHHPRLKNANIGVLFRETGIMQNGMQKIGNASKVTAKTRALLDDKLDFLIWLAADWWLDEATPQQQKALLDHELCHCYMEEGWNPKMRSHDIEEFAVIIERYGLDWRGDYASERVREAVQQDRLPFREPEYRGSVKAVDPQKAFADEVAGELESAGVM